MPILITILAAIMIISLVLLLILGLLRRSGIPGVHEWFNANAAMIAALPLLMLRDRIPDSLSVLLANFLLLFATASYYAGCARFLGRPTHWRTLWAGMGLSMLGLTVWLVIDESIPMRVLASALFTIPVWLSLSALMLQHQPNTRMPYIYWFTAALAFILGLSQTVRLFYFLSLTGDIDTGIFTDTWSVALSSVSAIIVPAMTMASIMMLHDAMLTSAEHVANLDHMTGALSRKRLEAITRERISQSGKRRQPLSLVLIDLDHFKKINDTYGHAAGDAVLKDFVQATRQLLRDGDSLGRIGGEEFVIILPGTGTAQALLITERLRMHIASRLVEGAFGACRYGFSAGVAECLPGENFEQLCARADQALYQAKHLGRGRVECDIPDAEISIAIT